MPKASDMTGGGANAAVNGQVNPLATYRFHGMELRSVAGGTEAVGTCPFCGKEHKWYVSTRTRLWQCKSCNEGNLKGGGNPLSFLRTLWDYSRRSTTAADYAQLARQRRLLAGETARAWGLAKSILTGEWLVPGYNAQGQLIQLYRYAPIRIGGKPILSVTTGLPHGVFGVPLYLAQHGAGVGNRTDSGYTLVGGRPERVYLCEGLWDGMALWEVMRQATWESDSGGGRLILTGNVQRSLLGNAAVLATPSCGVYKDTWAPLLAERWLGLLYDSDHPAGEGKPNPLARPGWDAMQRLTGRLIHAAPCPKEIAYLAWGGPTGEGYDPALPNGYDVRDLLSNGVTGNGANGNGDGEAAGLGERLLALEKLLGMLQPIPADWVPGRTAGAVKAASPLLEPVHCTRYVTQAEAWKKAVKWSEGLDGALAVCLAVVLSTTAVGDQLWLQLLSPPSTLKTTIVEALGVGWRPGKKYIKLVDTLTGLLSGYQSDREGSENMSLVTKLRDVTLVIKDGDTLLSLPNLVQILSQLRAFYDRNIRAHYGNKMSADHTGFNTTVILCGTASLRMLDTSELGERCLKYSIMDSIDDDLEDEILWRKVHQAVEVMTQESNGEQQSQMSAELVQAYRLTGGYVCYLREHAMELIRAVTVGDEAKRYCVALAKFVAYLRARPSKRQEELADRELAARLVSQIIRLARCLGAVLNRPAVDRKVLTLCRKVALDTASGITLNMCRAMADAGVLRGCTITGLGVAAHVTDDNCRKLLRFLKRIKAVEYFYPPLADGSGLSHHAKWRMTPTLRRLWRTVMNEELVPE